MRTVMDLNQPKNIGPNLIPILRLEKRDTNYNSKNKAKRLEEMSTSEAS